MADIKTGELIAEENRIKHEQELKHAKTIAKVAMEIEAILIREDLNWGDWGEVIDIIAACAQRVIPKIKISEIKKSYGKVQGS